MNLLPSRLSDWPIFFLAMLALFSRPSLPGEHYGLVIYAFMLGLLPLCGLSIPKLQIKTLFFLTLFLTLLGVILVHILFIAENRYVIIAMLTGAFVPVITLFFVHNKKKLIYYFDTFFVYATLMFCFSAIVSYLTILAGYDFYSFSVKTHQTNFIEGYANFIFPFSILGGNNFIINDLSLPRNFGFTREPGLFQFYTIMSIILIHYDVVRLRYKRTGLFILFAGLILTFSGAAIAVGLSIVFFQLFYKLIHFQLKSLLFKACILLILVYLFSPFIIEFLLLKIFTETGYSRYEFIFDIVNMNSFDLFIGTGFGQNTSISNINFIGTISSLGLFGCLIYILIWFICLANINVVNIIYSIPVIVTLLFFQPIFFDPIVWFIMVRLIFSPIEIDMGRKKLITSRK